VSESGGVVIDRVDIADTGSNSILLENCYHVNIAAQQRHQREPVRREQHVSRHHSGELTQQRV